MMFRWLKRYMPGSLYGRAALILVLPVVALQLVVTTAFIQRHFDGVTQQMTLTVAREVAMVAEAAADRPQRADDLARLLRQLEMEIDLAAEDPGRNLRRWYDFSGIVVISTLERLVPGLRRVLLPDSRDMVVFVDTDRGLLSLRLDRGRASARNPHQLLVVMLFFGVLMTLIAFLYLRNQLRPITRLARASEAFGRGRHEPYTPGGAVEVRAAGNAFLDMRARIERQIEQRTLMLSGVSHDLRTPLTRLKLGLSLLDDAEVAPLQRDVDDMQRLLDEFLSFASGASEGEPEEVDPAALVRGIVEDCARGGSNVEIVELRGAGRVSLRVVGVKRALENLIGNAVRYGTRAQVSVEISERFLRIRVEDDGPGIAPEERDEAIKPFARLEPARNQNRGTGVGLGLSIAADVARAHGGVLRLGTSARLGGLSADLVIAR